MVSRTTELRTSRRSLLALGAGAALAAAVTATDASAAPRQQRGDTSRKWAALERQHSARLGVFALDTATGATVRHRAGELFPVCSVAKTVAVGAVLRDLDRDGEFLARRIRYTAADVENAGHAPITGTPEHIADGMTVAELCAAAITHSDNAAMNLLLRELGGPTEVTRFCRSIGDPTTRLDRYEPDLNSAEPWRVADTTSPLAIARTYARLTLGDALEPKDRAQLTGWLLANTTGANRLRAGLPADWTLAEKTGTGDYGSTHDVGIAWPPHRAPIVLAVLSTKADAEAPADEPLLAEAAGLIATAVS
ncbi:class A beta-lactamase [Streptomyces cavernae]|uniref:class A beta-lactamase n=1 Tax=Streptomyces cavernae TaxID=2259034 RepID=UPI000FEBACA1|nr:class A beta-lactamase [Streptomyces cavernae]